MNSFDDRVSDGIKVSRQRQKGGISRNALNTSLSIIYFLFVVVVLGISSTLPPPPTIPKKGEKKLNHSSNSKALNQFPRLQLTTLKFPSPFQSDPNHRRPFSKTRTKRILRFHQKGGDEIPPLSPSPAALVFLYSALLWNIRFDPNLTSKNKNKKLAFGIKRFFFCTYTDSYLAVLLSICCWRSGGVWRYT